jgi:hypothetical protein
MDEGVGAGAGGHEGSGGPRGPTELLESHVSGARLDHAAAAPSFDAAGSMELGGVGRRAAQVRAGAKGGRTVGCSLQWQSMGVVFLLIHLASRLSRPKTLALTSEGWWHAAPSSQFPCQVEALAAQVRADVGDLSAQLHASSATPGRALSWGAAGSPWGGASSGAGRTPQHVAMEEVSSGLAQCRKVQPLLDHLPRERFWPFGAPRLGLICTRGVGEGQERVCIDHGRARQPQIGASPHAA